MIAIYVDAGNDVNGNPRRGWIIVEESGKMSDFVDEGYMGSAALKEAGYGHVTATWTRITVTPGYYRSLRSGKGSSGSKKGRYQR